MIFLRQLDGPNYEAKDAPRCSANEHEHDDEQVTKQLHLPSARDLFIMSEKGGRLCEGWKEVGARNARV